MLQVVLVDRQLGLVAGLVCQLDGQRLVRFGRSGFLFRFLQRAFRIAPDPVQGLGLGDRGLGSIDSLCDFSHRIGRFFLRRRGTTGQHAQRQDHRNQLLARNNSFHESYSTSG